MKVSAILPTHDEAGHIVDLVGRCLDALRAAGVEAEVIVVDDQSADGTPDRVAEAFRGDPAVRVIRRSERGLAGAVRRGVEEATGGTVAVMDADFAHDPAHLPLMLSLLDRFDLVIGSRFVRGGGMDEEWRYIASYLFNLAVRWTLFTRIQDNLSGFFIARRALILQARADVFTGYGDYFIRLVSGLADAGAPMIEVPVWYRSRPTGTTKTRFVRVLLRYAAAVLRLAAARGLGARWKGPCRPPAA